MQPVTPPRQRHHRAPILTPTTPRVSASSPHKSKTHLQPPSKTPLQSKSPIRHTHLRTPALTPRHRKKGLNLLGDGFIIQQPTRALFPPTPSSVGSGRIKDVMRHKYDETSLMMSPEQLVIGKKKLTFGMEQAPSTPSKSIITDELKTSWLDFVPEDHDDGISQITSRPLVNPFVSTSGTKKFVIRRPSNPLDKIEYVNKKGERIIKDAGKFDDEDEQDKQFDTLGLPSLHKNKKKIMVYNDDYD